MAVGFGHSATAVAQASVASFNITLNTTGDQCAVVFVCTFANSGNPIDTGCTIGGVTAPLIPGSLASDTITEPGGVQAYFLDGVTQGATTTVTVTRTNNTVVCSAAAISMTALSACEVYTAGIVLTQQDGAYAEQSIDDGSPGTNSLRLAGGYYGGATPAPVGANTTSVLSDDRTAFGWTVGRETTAGQGARLVGFTQATADDRAATYFAVREVPPAQPIPELVMAPMSAP